MEMLDTIGALTKLTDEDVKALEAHIKDVENEALKRGRKDALFLWDGVGAIALVCISGATILGTFAYQINLALRVVNYHALSAAIMLPLVLMIVCYFINSAAFMGWQSLGKLLIGNPDPNKPPQQLC